MNNLKKLRQKANLTLEQLANLTGTTKSHMHAIEKCQVQPRIYLALSIASALNVSVYEVFLWNEGVPQIEHIKNMLIKLIAKSYHLGSPAQTDLINEINEFFCKEPVEEENNNEMA